jgi:outer membrane protein assembly factor BamB
MKNLYAAAIAIGLGILGVAASRALLHAAPTAPAPPAAPETFVQDVTQHHRLASRSGLYLDPLFTQAAAANLTRDLNFNGTIVGNVYAQPLFLDITSSPIGPIVIVATESNNVYALNATTGAIVWQRNVGTPSSGMGNIAPLGITGTPVIDIASRTIFFDAVVAGPNNLIFSLNGDTGAINPGWPVDVNAAVPGFSSSIQSQRAALGLMGGVVYVPYGGYFGDAGNYHGRLVGVQMNNPASVMSWATTALKSGVWGPGGVANDGTNLFVTTGNAPSGTTTWGAQESIVRLQAGPIFSGATTDFWTPTNWQALDTGDTDLGGSGPILVDVPGATPSALVVALGKDGNAYLVNRNNLGGISAPIASSHVGSGSIIQAAATYRTSLSTYVVFRANGSTTTSFKITATNPPTIATGWTVTGQSGRNSPFVTTTDGSSNVIVWVVGAEGDQRLHGYDGDTGNVVYNGGGPNELMAGTQRYNTAIAARGRIYVANNNKVYAFSVPTGNPTPTPTATPVTTPTPTPVTTPTPTPATTPTPTPPATPTPTPAVTPTPTPVGTPTPTPSGTPSATPTAAPTSTPTPVAQALNLSTRMRVQTGANVGIGGFIVTGTGPKHVLLRAIGPSLTASGVPNVLADPVLELHGPGAFVTVTDDNWRDDPVQEALIIASGIPPSNDLESAIDATLVPGNYTAIMSGKNNTSGVGLVEVYDLNHAVPAKLANISTRAFVSTGSDIVIAGFILGGNSGNDRIAVRGIGPSLTSSGVPNALADPVLELRDGNGTLLVSNNDWHDNPVQASELIAAGLALTNDLESGIATTLPPGTYTALLAGLSDGTGVGLVEVYDLGAP